MAEQIAHIGGIQEPRPPETIRVTRTGSGLSFSDVLKSRLERDAGISFSAHAVERLRERDITLERPELARLSDAVSRAEDKGAGETLVLLDDLAFIVNVRNKTVVTAMSGKTILEHVFTNIDSTVIA